MQCYSCVTACRRRLDAAETGYLKLATALLEAPDPLPVLQGAAMLVLELEGEAGCPHKSGSSCFLLLVLTPSAGRVCYHRSKGTARLWMHFPALLLAGGSRSCANAAAFPGGKATWGSPNAESWGA